MFEVSVQIDFPKKLVEHTETFVYADTSQKYLSYVVAP